MPKWRVLNMMQVDHIPHALDPLKDVADVVTVGPDQDELLRLIPEFDGYFASLHAKVTREVIDAATRLKVIATSSTGTDHIDMAYCEERGLPVLSLKKDTDFLDRITATAEMGWCLMLAALRKLPWSFDAAKRGHWARDEFRGRQISEKTLGILGYGRLGKMWGEYGKGFRMRVIAHDVLPKTPDPWITMVDFDTLLAESDFLAINIHLTPENTHLFNREVFSRMKPGSCLINTSRGAIIDDEAFIEALENGPLACAGTDVIYGEWDEDLTQHPLIEYANAHDNLVISPHTGGVTYESQGMAFEFTAAKMARFLKDLEAQA